MKCENKDQLYLFNEAEETYASSPGEEKAGEITVTSYTRKSGGRRPLPEALPREEVIHDLREDEKVCGCGTQLSRIGEEVSEKPVDYPGWNGPYLSGPPNLGNPNFVDGWGNLITMLVWIDYGTYGLPPHPFTFTDLTRNDASHPLGKYQAVLVSSGTELEFSFDGSGTITTGVEVDNDGDGSPGEDDVDGIDNDGDGRIDEDPPAAYEGPLDLHGTNDHDAPNPFRLISIRDILAEKIAQTRKILWAANDAAAAFNNFAASNGIDDDGDTVIDAANGDPNEGFEFMDQIISNVIDDDMDGNTDEPDEEIDYLRVNGFIGASYINDMWGHPLFWDPAPNHRFYSAGPDGDKTSATDNVY